MDFEPTAEQAALVESARAVLARECPLARELVEKGVAPAEPWRSAGELGGRGIAVPEALLGGSGWHCERIASLLLA